MKFEPTILIDTREQTPLVFRNLPSKVASLPTGDYSVAGLESLISIERKSLPDLCAVVGRERPRFLAELQRLRAYRFRCLLVEATATDLLRGGWRSKVTPAAVAGSLMAWQAQYGLPVLLAADHEIAATLVEKYLYQCVRVLWTECEAIQALMVENVA